MRRIVGLAAMALLASCGGAGTQPKSASGGVAKSLAGCPALPPLARPALARTGAVVLPKGSAVELTKMVASSRERMAITTLGGGSHCLDVRLMSSISNIETLQGGRYVSFGWTGTQVHGYPADGHILVDRMGSGNHEDTGGRPVFSPSGQLFAAAYQSDTAFARLDGFAVWQITPSGPVRISDVTDLPDMLDWRVDSWGGEDCVNLSAVPFARVPAGSRALATITRDRFTAKRLGRSWRVTESFRGTGCLAN